MEKEISEQKKSQADKHITWEQMTPAEKKKQLFLNQKELLDLFRERNAISQAQYEKSLGDLRLKMGFPGE